MPIPKPFNHPPSAIASYNFTDIADGTGVVEYLAFESSIEGGNLKHLNTQTVYSASIETFGTVGTSSTKVLDLDFDLTAYNAPTTIRGTALVSVPLAIGTSISINTSAFVIVRIRKWDGSTETTLASEQSETITQNGAGYKSKVFVVPVVIPKTSFKKGETFRITTEAWAVRDSGGGTHKVYIAHDPINRNGVEITPSSDTNVTTVLKAAIPYDIDI